MSTLSPQYHALDGGFRASLLSFVFSRRNVTTALLLKGQEIEKVAFVAKKLIKEKVNPRSRREDVGSIMRCEV